MSGTTLADALDALVAVYTPAAPPDFTVIDGDPPQSPPRKFLCVGWGGPDGSAGSGQLSAADYSYDQTGEAFLIGCVLSYWDGSRAAQLAVVRRAAMEAFNALDAALAADRSLNGVVLQAAASPYEYVPDTNREGALVELHWTVSGTA